MIIGLAGSAGSGKDTVAGFLKKIGYASIALADPLKRICAEVFDWDEERLWGPSECRNLPDPRYLRTKQRMLPNSPDEWEYYEDPLTAREALQTLGTEWGRKCFPDIWIDKGMRTAKELDRKAGVDYDRRRGVIRAATPPWRGVAITDVRFANEVEAIQERGGKVLLVQRPGAGLTGAAAEHPSEKELREMRREAFDAVIANTGTLADLERLAIEVVESLENALEPT